MSWLHYLIEANIYLGVFYLCYCLFLNNETHYMLGRIYLLFSCVLAFTLPLTQLSMLKKPVEQIQLSPLVYIPAPKVMPHASVPKTPEVTFSIETTLLGIYIIGVVIALCILLYRLYKLSALTRGNKSRYADKYTMVRLKGSNTAFSFFNYLFIGDDLPRAETIIAHELVHIKQKHSADIIFIELLKVINWFNPLIYLVQRSLRTVHEYIADEQTAAYEQDAISYSSFLVNNAYGVQGAPIAHSFFNYNLLKKRIIMLNQKRSGNLARLKYLLAVPLCAGMLCTSTLVFSKDYAFIDLAPKNVAKEKPELVKYFKITDKKNNLTAYSDNLSFTEGGVKKMFLAKSVTQKDIAYIKKMRGLTVEVIDVDSKTKMQVPMVIKEGINTDTPKYKRPIPPPPIEVKDGFADVHVFLSRAIKYPKTALVNEERGNALVSFNVTSAGKISNVQLLKKAGGQFDNLLVNALPKFPGKITAKPGTYKMEVIFDILGGNFVSSVDSKTLNSPDFAGQAQIMGMTDEQYRKMVPLPPPPAPPAKAPKKVGKTAPKLIRIPPPIVVPDKPGSIPPPPPPVPAKAHKVKPAKEITMLKLVPAISIDVDSVQLVKDEPAKTNNTIKLQLKEPRVAQVKSINIRPVVKTKIDTVRIVPPQNN
ncbi:hypothetical protein DYU05_08095 [Mucilaginibacter terrenus]|uniref:TonB C-terminal domain-containing protein n=1 Tax=Mucilaginibacter terrenus TaxID=2482727 RepID=A0A3E2NWZ7_9SPHI|nr:M56 family metallopeptidase [Mucilaginibacter terrenus]RFZ85546.1 hypothetical protein DYU05_08095 [Mucilaginibacter terrenus]